MSDNPTKPDRIHRARHGINDRYVQISRDLAQDRTLTYEARGLLLYVLSKPTDWYISPPELMQDGAGRDKVYNILKELIAHRYVVRTNVRNERTQRVEFVDYEVFEEPLPEKPLPDLPDRENTDSTNNRVLQKTDSTNKSAFKPNQKYRKTPKTPRDSDDDVVYDEENGKKTKESDRSIVVRLKQVVPGFTRKSNVALRNLSLPIQTPSGTESSPADLWDINPYWHEWVENKIEWWQKQNQSGDDGMIYLVNLILGGKTFNHPVYGWPAYQEKRRSEDLRARITLKTEESELARAARTDGDLEVAPWAKPKESITGGMFDQVAEE